MLGYLLSFFRDEDGLTVVEYVASAALLAVILITIFAAWEGVLLQQLSNIFS